MDRCLVVPDGARCSVLWFSWIQLKCGVRICLQDIHAKVLNGQPAGSRLGQGLKCPNNSQKRMVHLGQLYPYWTPAGEFGFVLRLLFLAMLLNAKVFVRIRCLSSFLHYYVPNQGIYPKPTSVSPF